MAKDMWGGAEAYLEMWERADGIRTPRCADSDHPIEARERGVLRLGSGWLTLLRRAGQPQQRTRAWSWCVAGTLNRDAADVAVLGQSGKVELVGSTAHGRSAGGVLVGSRARRLRTTSSAGNGIRFRLTRRGALAYAVSGGRVVAVAVASRGLARQPAALRAAMRRLLRAKATSRPRSFVPSSAQAAATGAPTGKPLAGTYDPRLNAALTMLCGIQAGGTNAFRPAPGFAR
jgi:hypothetical protein